MAYQPVSMTLVKLDLLHSYVRASWEKLSYSRRHRIIMSLRKLFSHHIKFYFKYFLYYVYCGFISGILLPYLLFHPMDVLNQLWVYIYKFEFYIQSTMETTASMQTIRQADDTLDTGARTLLRDPGSGSPGEWSSLHHCVQSPERLRLDGYDSRLADNAQVCTRGQEASVLRLARGTGLLALRLYLHRQEQLGQVRPDSGGCYSGLQEAEGIRATARWPIYKSDEVCFTHAWFLFTRRSRCGSFRRARGTTRVASTSSRRAPFTWRSSTSCRYSRSSTRSTTFCRWRRNASIQVYNISIYMRYRAN